MVLKKYVAAQEAKVPTALPRMPSGIACTEKKCSGEMMYIEPQERHPELPNLKRAVCGECGWRGWC